jgi:hypothetical protein
MRKSIIGGLGVGSGMAIFLAVSPPTGGVSAPSLLAWAPALAGITALIMLSAFVALRARGIANVIWLAAATAVIYAFVNAVTKSGVDLLTSQGAGVPATWEPYALMAAGILSGLFGQSAFNAGPLSLSLPVIDTVEPVCSVILRIARFHAEPVCGHCGVIIGFGFADPATVLCAGRGYRLSSMLIRRPPTLTGQIAVTLGVLVAVNGGG